MLGPRTLLIVIWTLVLGGCAASRPAKSARYAPTHDGARSESLGPPTQYLSGASSGEEPSLTFERRTNKSFESVTESSQDKTLDAAPAPAPVASLAPPAPPGAPEGGQPPTHPPTATDVLPGQMLVYTASLTMAVYQVDQGLAVVERVARELDGYLATRGDLAISIRVPRAKFDAALKAIETSGDVVHRDIKAEDVTDEFFDTEVRARNARAMRDRLAKLLQQAAVKEALEIEKELGRVTQEIELLEGKLKLLRNRVAYSTINVTFRPREVAMANRPTRLPFPWLEALGLRNLLQLNEGK